MTGQRVIYAVPPVDGGFNSITVLDGNLGLLTDSPEPGPRSLDVLLAVLKDLDEGRSRTQYRVVADVQGFTRFAGLTGGATDPSLTVLYRER